MFKRRCGYMCSLQLFFLLILAISINGQNAGSISGVVKDTTGAAVAQATVSLLNARQAAIDTTRTNEQGEFTLRGAAPGTYELYIISRRGFAPKRMAVTVGSGGIAQFEIVLGAEMLTAEVTVTAEIGVVQSLDQTTQQVNVIDENKLEQRAKAVLAQIGQEEPGLQLQRTSPSIGAIFVRGVTGAKVVNYVDGIRFSTSTARGGINSFFNLNDTSNLRAVEVIRGPNSAQFGSDSIGGSVQLISRMPLYTAGGPEVHGQIGTHYNSADHSFGGNALLTAGNKDIAVLVNLASHRSNTVRPGGGFDTHSAVNRFLGLRSDLLLGERSPDTAFTQYGGLFKLSYRLTDLDQLTVHYQRAQIDGGKRFDQTIGGDGNLIADLRNFMLDFFYGRYERFQAGWFDTFSLSYSYNAQREERVNQGGNGNPLGGITHQPERTVVHGAQAQASRQWSRDSLVIGGEFYYDRVRAPSYVFDPSNGSVTLARPRVPNNATYRSGGIYVQNVLTAIPDRLRLIGALRYGRASYNSRSSNSPLVNGRPLWPDDKLTADAVTPRFGAVLTLAESFTLSAQVSRGFRTPHITDLGTLGLTGNGFEANAVDLAGKGATFGTTAGSGASSTGIPVAQLKPETSWSYEGGVHFHRRRVDIDVNGFVNDIYDNIVLQSLILPQGAVGLQLGDQKISSQNSSGVVFVPASTNPVLIRANFGDSRIYGIEQKFDLKISRSWTLGQNFTYLHAADKQTGLPPTIEGGTPAPQGNIRLRYDAPGGRFWVEPYLYGARRQNRLSTLDLDDRRTGASRSRSSIQNFFRRGATVRGFVSAGADLRFGTADDILNATGETLTQVQNRLLGTANSAPLYSYIPGFMTFGIRGGFRVSERQNIVFDFENLNDKNYRGISWGMDAPGRSFGLRYNYRF
ncbi:MAG: TonB-dependent receptor [Acidobacteria bacterium]|nr:TonB-dependent receptor [Acidobacteriota bacterium]